MAEIEIEVLSSYEAIQALRPFWERLQRHPNSDLDHFLLVCQLLPEVISPFVFLATKGGQPLGLVAARLEHGSLQPRLGYLNLMRIPAYKINVINAGVLGEWDQIAASCFLDKIQSLLAEGRIDAVVLNHVIEDSCLFSSLARRSFRALGLRSPSWSSHWELTLPREPGFLLKAMRSKHRSWIKRKERDLVAAFPGRIQWHWHTGDDDLGRLCADMEQVAKTTYQRGLRAGFIDGPVVRDRLALFAARNQLRVFLLEIEGLPKAFWLGFSYHGVFHSSATGYVPELRDFEVGSLLFLRMVDQLVKEGVGKIDFGLGDAFYKQRFGDHSWRETTFTLFGHTPKGTLAYCLLTGTQAAEDLARQALTRLGIADRVKARWRQHVRK